MTKELYQLYVIEGERGDSTVTMKEVKNNWDAMLDLLKKDDQMTALLVEKMQPKKVSNGALYIKADSFMKKRILEKYGSAQISRIMKDLTGKNIEVYAAA